jgi:hypothetical protein
MTGEKIYEYDVDIAGVTDYGLTMEAVLSGQVAIPPQGVRIDVAFAGRASGRLAGQVRGVDYLRMRADGRIDLDIRATIETDAGQRIALSADGVALPRPGSPMVDLAENVTLSTAVQDFAWVNGRQIWAVGTVDLATGKIHLEGHMQ